MHVVAALHSERGETYHADTKCHASPSPRRMSVGTTDELARRGLVPCRKCWVKDGYRVSDDSEVWELGAVTT